MSSPPLKRQRRLVTTQQHDKDESERASEDNQNIVSRSLIKSHGRLAKQHKPSAEKNVGRTKPVLDHTFFNSKTQLQTQVKLPTQTAQTESIHDNALDIEDDFNDKIFVHGDQAGRDLSARKSYGLPRDVNSYLRSQKTTSTSKTAAEISQRLELPDTQEGLNYERSWIDLYPPSNIEELSVHKRKIEEVDRWLETSMKGHCYQRLLILKGPAGCAKTTTVNLLSKKRGINVVEWSNPFLVDPRHDDYVPLSARFGDFINRSAHFRSLRLYETLSSPLAIEEAETEKAIIVIDDFPVSVQYSSTALASIREVLILHLQLKSSVPMIMIFSEDESSMSGGSDGLNMRKLLGSDVIEHPALAIIEFNKVAPTYITKALEIVLDKQIKASGHRYAVTSSILRTLGDTGDIRNAINNLQLLCTGGDGSLSISAVTTKSRTFGSHNRSSSNIDKVSNQGLFHRDNSDGLFHSIGKVVYNKREGNNDVQPPAHFPLNRRLLKSNVDIDAVIQHLEVSNETYLLALHENYILSCESPNFLEFLEKASTDLSDADALTGKIGRNNRNSNLQTNEAIDFSRQEEISLQTAIRGLLFSLPYPVKRSTGHTGKTKRQMTYPIFARLNYQQNEVRNHMEKWLVSATASSADKSTDNPSNYELIRHSKLNLLDGLLYSTLNYSLPMTRITGNSLVLYDMPYSAMMLRQRSHCVAIESLLKAVQFSTTVIGKTTQNSLDIAPAFVPSRIPDEISHRNSSKDTPRLCLSEDDIEDG